MNSTVSFFPEFSDYYSSETKIKVEYSFFFYKDNDMTTIPIELKYDTNGHTINFKRNKNGSFFESTKNDLFCVIKIKLEKATSLYGEDGIAPTNSKLGFCIEYYSQKSKFRQVSLSNNCIKNEDDAQIFNFQILLEKATFTTDVTFKVHCFLKESAEIILENESFLNNKRGVILGTIDVTKYSVEEPYSIFPILSSESFKNKNLWELQIDYYDPYTEKICDCIKLFLNANHDDYKFLNTKSTKYCDSLIVNIVINCVTILITKLITEVGIPNDTVYPPDTLIGFVQYFNNHISSKDSLIDITTISKAVRNYVYGTEDL